MGCNCGGESNSAESDTDPSQHGQKRRVRNGSVDESYQSDAEGTSAMPVHSSHQKEEAKREFKNAVLEGNESSVMHYVSEYKDVDLLGFAFPDGQTALHIAVQKKHYQMMDILLTNGANPNARNIQDGDTPLHVAVKSKSIKAIALLSKYGANPLVANNDHADALTLAELSDADMFRLLKPENREELLDHLTREDDGDASQTGQVPEESMTGGSVPPESGTPVPSEPEEVVDSENDSALNIAAPTAPQPKSGFLEKKGSMNRWQRRWVLMQDGWFLWNDKEIEVDDVTNPTERAKFNGSAHVLTISDLKMVQGGKTHRKFTFKVNIDGQGGKDTVKDYLWKAEDLKKRVEWVRELEEHQKHARTLQQ